MRATCSLIFVAASFALWSTAVAQETKEPSRQVLETMERHVSSLTAVARPADGEESPLKLVAKPILRYSDPGGITTDASIWAWGTTGRPAALAGVFFLNQERKEPKWSCELLSLAEEGVTIRSNVGWSWSPDKGGLNWLPIEGTPADAPRQRLRQMKEIAERFEVVTVEGAQRSQLRLMVQPLYRYSDEPHDLIDGALFSFALGTNPETVLVLEGRRSAGSASWHAAFARFGANVCQARQNDKVVWECPAVKSWHPKEPYFSRFGAVEEVFGAEESDGEKQ